MYKRLLSYPYIIWMAIFVIAPMCFIAYYAFTCNGGFTLDNFAEFFSSDKMDYVKILINSLYMAVISTAICLLIGYPLSCILADRRLNLPSVLVLFFILPMWMNFLLRTYAMKSILNAIPIMEEVFMNKPAGVVLGMVYNFLPFMVLPIYSSLAKSEKAYAEAAGDLGASPIEVFKRITLPLSMPGVVSGITMVFMPAVSTFAISSLLGGGMVPLIGDVIQTSFKNKSSWDIGSSTAMMLLVLIFLSTALVNLLDKSRVKEAKN